MDHNSYILGGVQCPFSMSTYPPTPFLLDIPKVCRTFKPNADVLPRRASDQGLTLAHFRAQLEDLRDTSLTSERAQFEHLRDTSTD